MCWCHIGYQFVGCAKQTRQMNKQQIVWKESVNMDFQQKCATQEKFGFVWIHLLFRAMESHLFRFSGGYWFMNEIKFCLQFFDCLSFDLVCCSISFSIGHLQFQIPSIRNFLTQTIFLLFHMLITFSCLKERKQFTAILIWLCLCIHKTHIKNHTLKLANIYQAFHLEKMQ